MDKKLSFLNKEKDIDGSYPLNLNRSGTPNGRQGILAFRARTLSNLAVKNCHVHSVPAPVRETLIFHSFIAWYTTSNISVRVFSWYNFLFSLVGFTRLDRKT
jgi:hypothetical protein